jgi:hypothetical protein
MTVIFDTGASLAITPKLLDFVSPPKPLARLMKLGGMENGIEIKGIGIIAWTVTVKDGTEVQIRTEEHTTFQKQSRDCYHLSVFLIRRKESLAITVVMKTCLNSN